MNGFKLRLGHSGRPRWGKRLLIAGILALGMSAPASASSIQTRWENFLAGGTTEWASTPPPPITPLIKREIAASLMSSDPASSLFVQYLAWRRNLNPVRFDRWHPIEGPAVGRIVFPGTSTPDPVVNPQPQTIPEPGTMTLALGMAGAGLWWRRRSRRGQSA